MHFYIPVFWRKMNFRCDHTSLSLQQILHFVIAHWCCFACECRTLATMKLCCLSPSLLLYALIPWRGGCCVGRFQVRVCRATQSSNCTCYLLKEIAWYSQSASENEIRVMLILWWWWGPYSIAIVPWTKKMGCICRMPTF